MEFPRDNRLNAVDFLKDADNVYRTPEFIVKQNISTCFDGNCCGVIISDDTYYLRTKERDAVYDELFKLRGEGIDGKRMKAGMYRRTYVD